MRNFRNSRGRTVSGGPNPIDVFVGSKLKEFRQRQNLAQPQLAAMLGIAFQQIQKYERGVNRISASRLWDISRVLKVGVDDFFAGMDEEISQSSPRCLSPCTAFFSITDPMQLKEAQTLVASFWKIKDKGQACLILEALKAFSSSGGL